MRGGFFEGNLRSSSNIAHGTLTIGKKCIVHVYEKNQTVPKIRRAPKHNNCKKYNVVASIQSGVGPAVVFQGKD